MGPLRHVSDYETFEAYQEMGRSKFNLLIKEEGRLCAEHLEQALGIPHYFAPVAFRLPGIRENYEIIERSLGVVLDTDEYEQAASCQLAEARRRYAGSTAAVGAGAHSFEIARLLFETGVAVPYIFADAVTTREMEHYEWIRMNHPEAIIMPPTAPEMSDIRESALSVSFCVGYSAGYYCNGDVTVPLHAEIEYYGYLGLVRFLQAIDYAFENPEPIDSLTKKQVFII
jgi:nitrogenase molybdenum-iron protein alpha/beta subunit